MKTDSSTSELAAYDYDLPEERIAATPAAERDAARLMVLDRARGTIEHRVVRDLPEFLRTGDALVLNDTRVVPARLIGIRSATGGRWEGLFLGCTPEGDWKLLGQTRGRIQLGEQVTLLPPRDPDSADRLHLVLKARGEEGMWIARPTVERDPLALLERFGTVPLPPYIHRDNATEADWERYQTLHARRPGAVAAPPAGLHFTPELLARCRERGVETQYVTLHVGIGTFRPITAERLEDHRMHREWCDLPAETADAMQRARAAGGRVVAVGTTTVRTLESAAQANPGGAWQGETELFIRPPYPFQAVDAIVTNFHLPRSSLLVMLSAFVGRERLLEAYRVAIEQRYRFYSYGDAMLIV